MKVCGCFWIQGYKQLPLLLPIFSRVANELTLVGRSHGWLAGPVHYLGVAMIGYGLSFRILSSAFKHRRKGSRSQDPVILCTVSYVDFILLMTCPCIVCIPLYVGLADKIASPCEFELLLRAKKGNI